MEKLEKNITEVWKKVLSKTVISFKDVEELEKVFGNTFMKIQRQRERLEKSRDMWEKKYKDLKESIKSENIGG